MDGWVDGWMIGWVGGWMGRKAVKKEVISAESLECSEGEDQEVVVKLELTWE